jgi:adenine-specific DNA-methyltransferase
MEVDASLTLSEVKSILGQPAYEREGVLIFQGDSLDLMRRLPDGIVDLTVTSPPYNIGKEYEERLALADYLDWVALWAAEIHRLSKSSGQLWLNLGYVEVKGQGRAVPLPYLLWDRIPFFLRQEVVWTYGAGTTTTKAFAPRNEKFLWYLKDPDNYYFDLDSVRDPDVKYPNQKKNGKLRCNPLGKNPGDVWSIPKVTSGRQRSSKERMPHPAQFPEAVIERVILASSKEGDIVLDPFMGSGTTAAVATRLGRQSIGFELRPDYVLTTASRLDSLFASGLAAGIDDSELVGIDEAG